ncbi:Ammonium Transporter Family protein [uncultured archaeon]|nr:Ammonium Transporter Family protein [uncultured archaeon]
MRHRMVLGSSTLVMIMTPALGLFYGNAGQVMIQLTAVAGPWIYAIVMTIILARVIDSTIGLRVRDEEEAVGLYIFQHAKKA